MFEQAQRQLLAGDAFRCFMGSEIETLIVGNWCFRFGLGRGPFLERSQIRIDASLMKAR
jgi:hypothetical protein